MEKRIKNKKQRIQYFNVHISAIQTYVIVIYLVTIQRDVLRYIEISVRHRLRR